MGEAVESSVERSRPSRRRPFDRQSLGADLTNKTRFDMTTTTDVDIGPSEAKNVPTAEDMAVLLDAVTSCDLDEREDWEEVWGMVNEVLSKVLIHAAGFYDTYDEIIIKNALFIAIDAIEGVELGPPRPMDDRTAECILRCMGNMARCMADESEVDGLSPAVRARLSRVAALIVEEHTEHAQSDAAGQAG
jgi:hypothetical protein